MGGPQLLSATPRALSCSSPGAFNTSLRTVSTSPRQIASVMRQALTSRGQLAHPNESVGKENRRQRTVPCGHLKRD
jgi:hypothetical protein